MKMSKEQVIDDSCSGQQQFRITAVPGDISGQKLFRGHCRLMQQQFRKTILFLRASTFIQQRFWTTVLGQRHFIATAEQGNSSEKKVQGNVMYRLQSSDTSSEICNSSEK
jgi:hypothetical protein